ncbi:MAG TPA: FHA domain-containing protein [Kribbella sp.]|nr:FHA domain-containing protein [Kribbella sp.]
METECVLSLGDQRWTLPPESGTTGDTVTIGRASNADIRLQADDQISRIHARLTRTAGTWTLHDESRNGTGLNGHRLTAPTPLTPGDRIHIGRSVLTFHTSPTRASSPTPDTTPASPPPDAPPVPASPAPSASPAAAPPPLSASPAAAPPRATASPAAEPAPAASPGHAESFPPAAPRGDSRSSATPPTDRWSDEPADEAYSPNLAPRSPAAEPPHRGEPADQIHAGGHATPADFQPRPADEPYPAGDASGRYGAPAGREPEPTGGEPHEVNPFAPDGDGLPADAGRPERAGGDGAGPGVVSPFAPDGYGGPASAGGSERADGGPDEVNPFAPGEYDAPAGRGPEPTRGEPDQVSPFAAGGYDAPADVGRVERADEDGAGPGEVPFAAGGYGVRAEPDGSVERDREAGEVGPFAGGAGGGSAYGDGPGAAGVPGFEADRGWAAYPSADNPEPVRSPWEISARIDQSQPNWNESDGWPATPDRDGPPPAADRRTSGAERRGMRLPEQRADRPDREDRSTPEDAVGTVRLPRVLIAAGGVIVLGLIVNLVVTFVSDGPGSALRWLVPPGIALVVAMVLAILDAAAPKEHRPGRFDVSVIVAIAVVLVGIGVGGFALTAGTEYVAGYLTGNESGADRLVKPVAKSGIGITVTVESVTYTSHFTRIEVLVVNDSKQAFTIPIDGTTFTAADGTALRADTGKSSWPSKIPAHGSEHGTITFKGTLPDSADQAVLTFKSGSTSFAVQGIQLTH